MPAKLVVISGPSGVGKTTLCQQLLHADTITRVVTATTRPPRPGESNGRDYHFLSREDFQTKRRQGFFLESATYNDNFYGTPKNAVMKCLAQEKSVLLNIDVQGAESIRKESGLPTVTIFLVPPSLGTLRLRLEKRQEDPEIIRERLAIAKSEMEQQTRYDHVVVNDDLRSAALEVQRILSIGS